MILAAGQCHEAARVGPPVELEHRSDVLVHEADVPVRKQPARHPVKDRQRPPASGGEGQAPARRAALPRQGQDAAPGAAVPGQIPGAGHARDVARQALDEGGALR